MTRFAHDKFAKDILDETLSAIGGVNPDKKVPTEVREIDIYFTPNPEKPGYSEYREKLGLLGKMAVTPLDDEEDERLMRAITPLFQEHLAAAEQKGIARGKQEENRAILENFMRVRFGALSPKSAVFITPVSTLPAGDFTLLLVQLSFLSLDESGVKRATELLAETVLRMRFGQLDESLTNVIPSLLALSLEDLGLLVSQLSQLSVDEFLGRFGNGVS